MTDVKDVSSFVDMVKHLNGGSVREELDAALKEGLQAINDFGGTATITFIATIAKAKGMDDVIHIKDDVKTKFPQEPRGISLMFSTSDNRLVTQQQDQESMKFEASNKQAANTPIESTATVSQIKESQ